MVVGVHQKGLQADVLILRSVFEFGFWKEFFCLRKSGSSVCLEYVCPKKDLMLDDSIVRNK